jgi:AcrR family transcriptional regulator
MTELRAKGDVTKGRLLEATENLVAEKGFDAVSVRDITGLAKANVAAVNYHFGSREGLLAAVLEHRMKPLAEERITNLASLGEDHGVRELLQAWVSPLVSLLVVSGLPELAYCRVMGRCMEMLASPAFPEAAKASRAVDEKLLESLEKCIPLMSRQEIEWRLHFVTGALIHALVHGASIQDQYRLTVAVEQWVDAATMSFQGTDILYERNEAVKKGNANRRKVRATPQMRQVAEVVSSVMEADEVNGETADVAEDAPPVVGDNQNAGPVEGKNQKHKKSKGDDGHGELFLF